MYILAHERGTLAHPAPHFPSFRAAKTQKEKPRPPDGGNGGMTVLPVCYRWAESNCPLASTMASPPPAYCPARHRASLQFHILKLYQNFINFDTGRLNENFNFVLYILYTVSPLCLIFEHFCSCCLAWDKSLLNADYDVCGAVGDLFVACRLSPGACFVARVVLAHEELDESLAAHACGSDG